jgi:hypothetical protein
MKPDPLFPLISTTTPLGRADLSISMPFACADATWWISKTPLDVPIDTYDRQAGFPAVSTTAGTPSARSSLCKPAESIRGTGLDGALVAGWLVIDPKQVTLGPDVRRLPGTGAVSRHEFTRPPGALGRAVECDVDQDPTRVSGLVLHDPHSRPVPGDPQQGFLDEVLSLGQIPGHEVGGAQQRTGTVHHEPLELLPGRARSQPVHPRSILRRPHPSHLYQPPAGRQRLSVADHFTYEIAPPQARKRFAEGQFRT